MKKLFRIVFTLLIVIALLYFIDLYVLQDPPVWVSSTDNPFWYSHYNHYVKQDLEKNYQGILPDRISRSQCISYQYDYSCGLIGDPQYNIALTMQYDADFYMAEKCRILRLAGESIDYHGGICILSGSREDFQHYLDDEVLDGMFYRFEIARFDDSQYKIAKY